jgi:hypothetical protein
MKVHHITPESDGGPNTIDNAAPLCGSCRQKFGNNPDLQRQLREMRDWWWKRCEESKTAPAIIQVFEKIDQLHTEFFTRQDKQDQILYEIKNTLKQHYRNAESAINSASTFNEVIAASSEYTTGVLPMADYCPHCGNPLSFPGQLRCPNCGIFLDDVI